MEMIHIRRHNTAAEDPEQFVVPAVAIRSKEGKTRLIPHPFGRETKVYPSLEQTLASVHRAGYDAEFEGTFHPAPHRSPAPALPRPQPRLRETRTPISDAVHQAIPLLYAQLSDKNPSVVASAAFALGEIRDEGAIQGLVQCLANDDATVRKHASEALAKIGRPALSALRSALKDGNWVVRHSAIGAVMELLRHGKSLVPEILEDTLPHLKDESWLVRSQAATLYGEAYRAFNTDLDEEEND